MGETEVKKGANSKTKAIRQNFNARFSTAEVQKIRIIKDDKGFKQTIDLFRYLITREYEKIMDREESSPRRIHSQLLTEAIVKPKKEEPEYGIERVPILK